MTSSNGRFTCNFQEKLFISVFHVKGTFSFSKVIFQGNLRKRARHKTISEWFIKKFCFLAYFTVSRIWNGRSIQSRENSSFSRSTSAVNYNYFLLLKMARRILGWFTLDQLIWVILLLQSTMMNLNRLNPTGFVC